MSSSRFSFIVAAAFALAVLGSHGELHDDVLELPGGHYHELRDYHGALLKPPWSHLPAREVHGLDPTLPHEPAQQSRRLWLEFQCLCEYLERGYR